MPRTKNYLILAAVFFFAAATIYFIVVRFTFKEESVRALLVPRLESALAGTLQYQRAEISTFPVPQARLIDAEFLPEAGTPGGLKAKTIRMTLNPLLFMFGRPQLSKLEIEGGTLQYSFGSRAVTIEDFNAAAGPLRKGGPVRSSWSGRLLGEENRVSGNMVLTAPRREAWTWTSSEISGSMEMKQLPAAQVEKSWGFSFPIQINQGMLDAEIHFDKKRGDPLLNGEASAQLSGAIYQLKHENAAASPVIEMELEKGVFAWNPEAELLEIKETAWSTPIARLEASGRINYGTGELQDLRIMALGIAMESIPQYDMFVKESLPVNVGFSGTSNLEISLTGIMDHLSLHANWDLTPALLTYGRFFSKPKDLPASIIFDFLLKEHKTLSGDFSFRLKEASAKGTVTDFDVASGRGEVNVITNKFELAGWQELLPPFQSLDLKGQAKILANLKGFLQDPEEISKMWNVTVENGEFLRGGRGFRKVFFTLDYGPVELRTRDLRFEIGGTEIAGNIAAHQWPENPSWKFQIESPKAEPAGLMSALEQAVPEFFIEKNGAAFGQTREFILALLPRNEVLEKFNMEGTYSRASWTVQNLNFDAYGGGTHITAQGGKDGSWLPLELSAEIERWSLARYTGSEGEGDAATAAGGNLFLTANLKLDDAEGVSPWRERIQGQGELAITNGEFYALDLLGEASRIDELSALASASDGRTAFDDLRAPFRVEKGKAMMEKIMLVSGDLIVEGSGETTLDGILNYRLDAYIAAGIASQMGMPFLENTLSDKKYFGPVPFVLAGPLAKPELKPDPARLPDLKDNIARRRSNKVLRNFLAEDYFFERRTNT